MKTADPSSHSSGDAASYYGHSAQASKPTPVFLFMGKTGAGKSTMIKLLGGKNIDGAGPIVDGGIESCTFKSCPYSTEIDNNKVILLDTPGFDDSARDNLQILREIASHLRVYSLRESEFEIRGIVFLHDIGETRLGGSQRKTWQILKEICGEAAMSNVLVGTTMWGPQGSKKFLSQEAREKELKGKHWNGIYKSTRVVYDDQDNATQIIKDLLARPSVLLLVQKEMLIPPHTVENTTAGRVAMPEGQAEKEQAQREYEEAQKKAEEEKRQHEEAFQRQQEEEKRKFEEEKKRKEEEERKRKEEEDRQRQKREQERREEEERQRRHYEEEQRRIKREAEERRRRAEEEEKRRRQEEERRRVDEMRKIQEEYRRREEEERRRAEEMRKIQEEYRRREERERRRREEERRRQEEEEWREELRRREEVERRRREEEERRRQEERHRQWEENRRREQEAQRERERWQRMIDEQNRRNNDICCIQ